ncbi:FkbM family methyltransferase [Chloroflexota bacterium]
MRQFIEKKVKKIFNTCGFEIYRRGSRGVTMADVLSHVSRLGFRPQTVIDVGAASGTFDLYENFTDASHILIEPLEEYEGSLKEILQKYKGEYVLAAAGSKLGTIVINVHPDLFGSSIFKETEGSHVDGVSREVAVVTIDDLCSERNLRGPYLIKVDAQSAELIVLDGARKTIEDTELIILEVSLFQFHVNGPQFYDVVSYMKDLGFVVYDVFGGHNRPLDGALAQIDMMFVKENGQFRKHHFYATREQRKQLTKLLSSARPKR